MRFFMELLVARDYICSRSILGENSCRPSYVVIVFLVRWVFVHFENSPQAHRLQHEAFRFACLHIVVTQKLVRIERSGFTVARNEHS